MDTSGVTTPCINHFNSWTELTPEISQAGISGGECRLELWRGAWAQDPNQGRPVFGMPVGTACPEVVQQLGRGPIGRQDVMFNESVHKNEWLLQLDVTCIFFGIEIAGFTLLLMCASQAKTEGLEPIYEPYEFSRLVSQYSATCLQTSCLINLLGQINVNKENENHWDQDHGPGRIHPSKFGSLYEILLVCNGTWNMGAGVGERSFL